MDSQTILDDEFTTSQVAEFKRSTRNKYLITIPILIVVNIILFTLFIKGERDTIEKFNSALTTFLFGLNILGFILGTFVALFPYKQLPYKKKYLRASLLSILSIQSIFTIGLIFISIMIIRGWY